MVIFGGICSAALGITGIGFVLAAQRADWNISYLSIGIVSLAIAAVCAILTEIARRLPDSSQTQNQPRPIRRD